MFKIINFKIVFVAFSASFAVATAQAAPTFITIGTAGVTGVYYPTGGAICRLLNKTRKQHGIRCTVESTGGSVYNLNTIKAGELDMAVAQSDSQYHAYYGTDKFSSQGPNKKLRSVFSVHTEPFTVVARVGSGIKVFDDLKGKRVNIGNPGSGQRETMEVLMRAKGWTNDDFKLVSELKSAEQSMALCDNKIDAIVFSAGHPSGSIKEATTSCDSALVSVAGPEVEELVGNNKFYGIGSIPGGMYEGNSADVATFEVGATFVSSEDVDDEVIYQLVKAVFENHEEFKRLHPAWHVLQKEEMINRWLTAPLHSGAIKYYTEAGLMK